MKINTNNIIEEENNWKREGKEYLRELEHFLDIVSNIKDEYFKREILMAMLRADKELTVLSEKLFKEYYAKGYEDGKGKHDNKKDNSRIIRTG